MTEATHTIDNTTTQRWLCLIITLGLCHKLHKKFLCLRIITSTISSWQVYLYTSSNCCWG